MASFTFTPPSVNFGHVSPGLPADQTVTITFNDPLSPTALGILISIVLTPGTQFVLTPPPVTLPFEMVDGDTTSFVVSANGITTPEIGIITVNTSLGPYTISVGANTLPGQIAVEPPVLIFPGTVLNTPTAPMNIVITNNGTSAVQLSNPVVSQQTTGVGFFVFGPGAPSFPLTLAANGGSVTIPVIATPNFTGPNQGQLSITTNLPSTPPVIVNMVVVGILFNSVNVLKGENYIFLQGFGETSEVRQVDTTSVNSELAQSLTFNGTLWDKSSQEKVIRRLQFYYENFGICTLRATAHVQRFDPNGKIYTDSQSDTVTFGSEEADGFEYSSFFDFQIAGEIVYIDLEREANAGPCYLYMFVPYIEDKGEKVEAK